MNDKPVLQPARISELFTAPETIVHGSYRRPHGKIFIVAKNGTDTSGFDFDFGGWHGTNPHRVFRCTYARPIAIIRERLLPLMTPYTPDQDGRFGSFELVQQIHDGKRIDLWRLFVTDTNFIAHYWVCDVIPDHGEKL